MPQALVLQYIFTIHYTIQTLYHAVLSIQHSECVRVHDMYFIRFSFSLHNCLPQGWVSVRQAVLSDSDTRPNCCEKQEILQRQKKTPKVSQWPYFTSSVTASVKINGWHITVRKGELCLTCRLNHWPLWHFMGHRSPNARTCCGLYRFVCAILILMSWRTCCQQ